MLYSPREGQWMDFDKSYWKQQSREHWKFYCPYCGTQRRVAFQPRPQAKHYFQILLTTFAFTTAAWNWLSFKGIVAFIPFWAVFEVIYRFRVRAALACDQCGFDPYLFLVDQNRAKVEMEMHWRKMLQKKGVPFPEKRKSGRVIKEPLPTASESTPTSTASVPPTNF